MQNIYGIDYGAKLAGTTVVAWQEAETVHFTASAKKQDADRFLLDFFSKRPPGKIFIDAPLSIPEVYASGTAHLPEGAEPDFHYRPCDRELGAMSPMFLGGLTARAMKLAFYLRRKGHEVSETYPGALARHIGLADAGYKGNKDAVSSCLALLFNAISINLQPREITTWHHFDALLAFSSALRESRGESIRIGEADAAIIF